MSQTATITRLEDAHVVDNSSIELQSVNPKVGRSLDQDGAVTEGQRQPPDDEPPLHAHGEVERWNKPRGNIGRLGFAFLSFIIAGMNDAAIGVRPVPCSHLMDMSLILR